MQARVPTLTITQRTGQGGGNRSDESKHVPDNLARRDQVQVASRPTKKLMDSKTDGIGGVTT